MLKLQIVFHDGTCVQFPAGGPIEAELVGLITDSICKGSLTIKSRERIKRDVEKAIFSFKENITKVPVRLDAKS